MFGELVMGGVAATGCLTGLAVARGRLFLDNRRFFADRRAAYEQWQAEVSAPPGCNCGACAEAADEEIARRLALEAAMRAVLADADCVVEDEAHRALRDI
jgi:hypothetical protein